MRKVNGKICEWAISSVVGIRVAQWAYFLHEQRSRRQQKRMKTQANLFVLPAALSPWSRPACDPPRSGTSPPIPANSLPSLEWGKESCRFLTMGLRGSAAKLIQSCLCPIPSAAHVTPLRWALTRSHRYYSCHGRQVAPLHYSTSGLPYHPLL